MPPRTYTSRRDLWVHLMLYPGHTLPTAIAPVAVGVGLAAHDGVFAFWPAFAAFVASWLVHVGGVFVDVHTLVTRWPTVREHPELNDAVANGMLRLPVLRAATLGWFLAAVIPGLYLLPLIGPTVAIALAAIGIAASVWYAAGPRSMASLGLADPIFLLMFGVVGVVGTYYVQAAAHGAPPLPWTAFVVGLPVGAIVNNVLVIDDLRDVEFDRVKGWRTTPVRHGRAGSLLEHLGFTLFAYAAPLAFAWEWGPWMLLPLLTLPGAIAAERAVWSATSREPLIPWTPRSAFLAATYALLHGVGLWLSA